MQESNTVDDVLAAALVRKPAQRVVKIDQPSGSPKADHDPSSGGVASQQHKKPMKPINLLILLVACAAAGVVSAQKVSEMRTRQRTFMRSKMAYSQAILEGLTLEKFDLVSKNALRMRDMTQRGDWFLKQEWFLYNNPEYQAAITNFHRQTDALFVAAADKNLSSAKEAYKNVVDSCVSCHLLFRAEQIKRR